MDFLYICFLKVILPLVCSFRITEDYSSRSFAQWLEKKVPFSSAEYRTLAYILKLLYYKGYMRDFKLDFKLSNCLGSEPRDCHGLIYGVLS